MMDVSREHSSQCSYRRPQIHPSYQLNLPGARARARWSSSPMMAAHWLCHQITGGVHIIPKDTVPHPDLYKFKSTNHSAHTTIPQVLKWRLESSCFSSRDPLLCCWAQKWFLVWKISDGQGLGLASLRILWRPQLPSIGFLLGPLSGGNNNRDWKACCIWPSATPSFFSRTR